MHSKGYTYFIYILLMVSFVACEQPEEPVELPKAQGLKYSYSMGSDYHTQVYASLENGYIKSVPLTSWDLAFDCDPGSKNIYLNGGTGVLIAETEVSEYYIKPTSLNQFVWKWDAANGMGDSLAFKNWHYNGVSRNLVYLVDRGSYYPNEERYFQLKVRGANKDGYWIEWVNLYGEDLTLMFIPKDPSKVQVYFSFNHGGCYVNHEPDKKQWDLCFLTYRSVYYEFNPPLLYSVAGAFTNTYQLSALPDSTNSKHFLDVTASDFNGKRLNNNRDAIGFDWKVPVFSGSGVTYRTRDYVTYYIRKRNGRSGDKLFKVRFIDFYDQNGNKGTPTFEVVRVQ